jgi:hypothetical protein
MFNHFRKSLYLKYLLKFRFVKDPFFPDFRCPVFPDFRSCNYHFISRSRSKQKLSRRRKDVDNVAGLCVASNVDDVARISIVPDVDDVTRIDLEGCDVTGI